MSYFPKPDKSKFHEKDNGVNSNLLVESDSPDFYDIQNSASAKGKFKNYCRVQEEGNDIGRNRPTSDSHKRENERTDVFEIGDNGN